MSSSRKKVIVRKLSRDWLAGYAEPTLVSASGEIELLDLSGKVQLLSLEQIKTVCFVRDFNSGEPGNPERLLRRTFSARPRNEGLWVRLRFRDNDQIEGLAANDLTLVEGPGLLLTPPDTRSNTQRIFVPRSAISELEIVAVIGPPATRSHPPATRSHPRATPKSTQQESLFDAEPASEPSSV